MACSNFTLQEVTKPWKFLRLTGTMVSIDRAEYDIDRVGKLLGVLLHMVGHHEP